MNRKTIARGAILLSIIPASLGASIALAGTAHAADLPNCTAEATQDGAAWYNPDGECVIAPPALPDLAPAPVPATPTAEPTIVEPVATPPAVPTPLPTPAAPVLVEPTAVPPATPPTPAPETPAVPVLVEPVATPPATQPAPAVDEPAPAEAASAPVSAPETPAVTTTPAPAADAPTAQDAPQATTSATDPTNTLAITGVNPLAVLVTAGGLIVAGLALGGLAWAERTDSKVRGQVGGQR